MYAVGFGEIKSWKTSELALRQAAEPWIMSKEPHEYHCIQPEEKRQDTISVSANIRL